MKLIQEKLFSSCHSPKAAGVFALAVFVVVIALDVIVLGSKISLTIPYSLPVIIASWMISRKSGLLFALVGTLAWTLIGVHVGVTSGSTMIIVLTGFIRFIGLSFIAVIISSMSNLTELYESAALKDQLTGIPNRRALYERLQLEIERAERNGSSLSIMFGDVDDFKGVNDKYGHHEGDELLRIVARVLTESFRKTDHISRFGGDEFIIVLPDTAASDALNLAERAVQTIEGAIKAKYQSGMSLGVVTFNTPPMTVDAAVKAADQMLYRAKLGEDNQIFAATND